MDHSQLGFDQNFSGAADDFPSLMRRKGLLGPAAIGPMPHNATQQQAWQPTEATTILAFKFSGGVLVAGDRRATAGNTVVYDRADKVLEVDRQSIMAIAGVPATAWEMARVLEHSLQYFRRTQLQEMSVDGKVRALAITASKRSALAPEVPTAVESGMPTLTFTSWFGFFGPKNMPK